MNQAVSVYALNHYVKVVLETEENLKSVLVEGEISGFKMNTASGHLYFSLRDERASVFAVMFRSDAEKLRFFPKDGMKVQAKGRVSLYEKGGSYQLIVDAMQPAGAGDQDLMLQRLHQKLAAEGLFDEGKKRGLPAFPTSVAVVTSRDGAAIRDIINVFSRRWPLAKILLCHSSVQGIFAEEELVEAIGKAGRTGSDLVIVSRGGGSKEDLFVFNSEKVVRAAAALAVPFISAVGHETDTTLIDLAADLRAPTPSAAAEMAVPDAGAVAAGLSEAGGQLCRSIEYMLQVLQLKVSGGAAAATVSAERAVELAENAAASVSENVKSSIGTSLSLAQNKLAGLAAVCDSLSPLSVLSRGYCRVSRNGVSVTRKEQLSAGDRVVLGFSDGSAAAVIGDEI